MDEGGFGSMPGRTPNEPQSGADDGRTGPPWEDPAEAGGYVSAYFKTARAVLFRPQTTFLSMSVAPRLSKPLLYWFVPTLLSTLVSTALSAVIGRVFRSIAASAFGLTASETASTTPGLFCVAACIVPRFFLMAGYYHLLLRVFGGARRGFGATLRALAYVNGSLASISWVPCLGPFVALGWGTYLEIIALRDVHETTTRRAATAVLVGILGPLALIAVILALGFAGWMMRIFGGAAPAQMV